MSLSSLCANRSNFEKLANDSGMLLKTKGRYGELVG
jgi:hypothetical protein